MRIMLVKLFLNIFRLHSSKKLTLLQLLLIGILTSPISIARNNDNLHADIPNFYDIYNNFTVQEKDSEAIQWLTELIGKYPKSDDLYYLRSLDYSFQGNFEGALADINTGLDLIDLQPENERTKLNRMQFLIAKSRVLIFISKETSSEKSLEPIIPCQEVIGMIDYPDGRYPTSQPEDHC